MSKTIVSTTFNKLTKNVLLEANRKVLKITKSEIDFYIHLNFKRDTNKLVVFSNGAIDRSKKKPPIFMRSSWANQINAHCIFVDDPTIHKSNLTIGWGIGEAEHYYLESISEIIKKIKILIDVSSHNTLYYGSSAGGTMSIMLSTMDRDSRALANNPQAYTYKYLEGKVVEKIRLKKFPNINYNDFLEKYASRLSIVECFRHYNYIPNILYVFNGVSITDYDRQYLPLKKDFKKIKSDISSIEFLIYHSVKLKHNPLREEKTVKLINDYLA